MKKEESIWTAKGIAIAEEWYPTSHLRFLGKSLQQLHISNLGNQEWRDIPVKTI
jgi:hypothetical protein